jgi:hypothetical protein
VETQAREAENAVNTTKETPEFKVPPSAREAWERISDGRGSPEDLQAVLSFLAKEWELDTADLRGFRRWLADQGILEANLPPSRLPAHKAAYALEQKARIAPTRAVVEAMVKGVYASDFLLQ